jgi:hypothetical protein
MAALGITGVPLVLIQHPLGGERPEAVALRASQAAQQIAGLVAPSG